MFLFEVTAALCSRPVRLTSFPAYPASDGRRGHEPAGFRRQIARAFRIQHLAAVALSINSPGGAPVQSAQIAKRIRDLARERDVPVIAFVEDIAASGGYWLACSGDAIFAAPASIVGSLGVVRAGLGFPELLSQLGVKRGGPQSE